MRICIKLQLGGRLNPGFPTLLQMAKRAFDGYLQTMFETLMETVASSIKTTQEAAGSRGTGPGWERRLVPTGLTLRICDAT